MCGPGQTDAPVENAAQALATLRHALTFLASTDMTTLTVGEQADCLLGLERADSMRIAARSLALIAFRDNQGHQSDGQGSCRSWLRWRAKISGPAASAAVAWASRLADHPGVRDALAQGDISVSWARQICEWTDLLPPSARPDADDILLSAAAAGADLGDLAGLAEEMRAHTAPRDSDDGDDGSGRSLRLDLHFRGAGRLWGDLTPRCAEALQAVLETLGKRTGSEDLRSREQRYHDALEEACSRLIGAGKLPQRAAQSTRIQLHMTLDDLINGPARGWAADSGWRRLYPDREDLTQEQRGAWPGPGAMATPGDTCDASIMPVVSGHVDHELLDKLAGDLLGHIAGASGLPQDGAAAKLNADFARNIILKNAVALLSGPSGLASRLRTGSLTGPAASISLPLDVGADTETVPPHLRRAVILRDVHCGFAGCIETDCQVHHIIPVAEGGKTCLENMTLGCKFHHLIAVHAWGWRVVLNPDGTKTTISPGGGVFRGHDPPCATAA